MTFRANYKGIGAMLRSPEMQAAMLARAEKVRAAAIASAPVETGRYKASFETSSGVGLSMDGTRRAYGRVTNTAPYAIDVEFGARNTPRHRVLGKALDAVNE